MNYSKYNFKKIFLALGVLLVSFLIFSWAYRYLTTASVSLTTDDPQSFLEITRLNGGEGDSFYANSRGSISLNVKPGTYKVSALDQDGESGFEQVVEAKAREKLNIDPTMREIPEVEPVYGRQSSSVVSNGSVLLFLDEITKKVSRASKSSKLGVLFPEYSFIELRWASAGKGIARDNQNSLYLVNGDKLQKIALPFNPLGNPSLDFELSDNGNVYISDGQTIFLQKPGEEFKNIYSSGNNFNQALSVYKDKVVFAEKSLDGQQGMSVVVLGPEGERARKNFEANSLAWSPDGKNLLIVNDSGLHVLSESLETINSSAPGEASNFTWLDPQSILYNKGGRLWVYDYSSNRSDKVASLAETNNLTSIYPDESLDYIYFSHSENEKDQLSRVGLKGQSPNLSITMSIYLPVALDSCSINYLNFTGKPSILMYSYPGQANICKTQAGIEMVQDGFSQNDFNYYLIKEHD